MRDVLRKIRKKGLFLRCESLAILVIAVICFAGCSSGPVQIANVAWKAGEGKCSVYFIVHNTTNKSLVTVLLIEAYEVLDPGNIASVLEVVVSKKIRLKLGPSQARDINETLISYANPTAIIKKGEITVLEIIR